MNSEVVSLVFADAPTATWVLDVTAREKDGKILVRGPAIHGRGDERFLYLSWRGRKDGTDTMFRRAKLQLDAVSPDLLRAAAANGTLVAHLPLTDRLGMPLCASVRPPTIRWSLG